MNWGYPLDIMTSEAPIYRLVAVMQLEVRTALMNKDQPRLALLDLPQTSLQKASRSVIV